MVDPIKIVAYVVLAIFKNLKSVPNYIVSAFRCRLYRSLTYPFTPDAIGVRVSKDSIEPIMTGLSLAFYGVVAYNSYYFMTGFSADWLHYILNTINMCLVLAIPAVFILNYKVMKLYGALFFASLGFALIAIGMVRVISPIYFVTTIKAPISVLNITTCSLSGILFALGGLIVTYGLCQNTVASKYFTKDIITTITSPTPEEIILEKTESTEKGIESVAEISETKEIQSRVVSPKWKDALGPKFKS